MIDKEQKVNSKSSNKVIGFWERYTDLRLELATGTNRYESLHIIGGFQALISLDPKLRVLVNGEYNSFNLTKWDAEFGIADKYGKIGPRLGLGAELY